MVRALEATIRRKDYQKKDRPPPEAHVISAALQALPKSKEVDSVRAAVLMIFYGAFRQGEVVPQTVAMFDPLRHLTRGDVALHHDRLEVNVKAGKNLQRFDQRRQTTIYKAQDPAMCLVLAVKALLCDSPMVAPQQPMFVFKGSIRPISAAYVRAQWKVALTAIGAPSDIYTLHTLRKAAVSTAYNSGLSERTVKHYGQWASDAYKSYIYAEQDQAVAKVLASTLHTKT